MREETWEQHRQVEANRWEGYVDWRNRGALKGVHGGMAAASFVLGVEILENLAYLANASNLVLYLREYMNLSPRKSANSVTNFMGTAFLLALLGGFLSDAFFTSFQIFLSSALVQFLGLIVLTIQAWSPSLKPPSCSTNKEDIPDHFTCQEVSGMKAVMLYGGLYIVALGVGGIKGSLPAHGADQFDDQTAMGRKRRSSFFNYFVFCLAMGALVAVTLVVWIEDNKGWQWGFGISTLSILLSIPVFLSGSCFYRNKIPSGSPLTTIFKVCLAAVFNHCCGKSPRNAIANMESENPSGTLKFLNRASQNKPVHPRFECSIQEVEDVKVVIGILPIFACTIMLNCCLAQLSTFSVQQAATMDTKLGVLRVPPASLPVFPVVFIMILAPTYDHFVIPFARRVTNSEMGISHLRRIGVGLFLSIVAMAVAAVVEMKRRRVAYDGNLTESRKPLPVTFLWVGFQYLFLGSADLFTLAGLLEFFFTEAPMKMRSLATSLSWASLAMGYYLSSVIVSIVNDVTGGSGRRSWLSGVNINHFRLDRFYWLMCVLSGLNFLHYLFWASKYRYRSNGNGANI